MTPPIRPFLRPAPTAAAAALLRASRPPPGPLTASAASIRPPSRGPRPPPPPPLRTPLPPPPASLLVRSLVGAADDDGGRAARRAALRAREEYLEAKSAQLEAMMESHGEEGGGSGDSDRDGREAGERRRREEDEASAAAEEEARMEGERSDLVAEASAVTRSLYRLCVRSARVMLPGNERDEADFTEREERQRRGEEEGGGPLGLGVDSGAGLGFSPPVDRENELRSRYEYYVEHIREEFAGDSDCLSDSPWMGERDVGRYVWLVRAGERRRRWVLDDYGFEDPYEGAFDSGRLERFEERAWRLVRDVREARGWTGETGAQENEDDGWDDIFADDEDLK